MIQRIAPADNASQAQMKGANMNLGELVKAFSQAFPLHSERGSFTMSAAISKTVTDTTIKTGSIVMLMPTNASAATLLSGAHNLYFTTSAGVGFTVHTADGVSAAGTETFDYLSVSIG
jgi:hypothetical protein